MTTFSKRLATLRAILPTTDLSHIERAEGDSRANWRETMAQMSSNVSPALRERLAFVHALADVTDDDVALVGAFSRLPHVSSLRDVALLPKAELGRIVDETIDIDPGAAEPGLAKAMALEGLSRRLFAAETTSVVRRMVRDDELPIARPEVKAKVAAFFEARPDFDIRVTSLYSVLGERADEGSEGEDAEVVETLKTLQRVQAISPRGEAVATLMARRFASAQAVTDVPEATFLAAHGAALGLEDAKAVYTNAASVRIRNEHALMGFRETFRGSGLRAVDGDEGEDERKKAVGDALAGKNLPFNLETLFGSQDMCECSHCTSVLSPAAYYVELLQYLRNNNTKTDDPKSLVGTPLEHLFARRPDLGCLELTCENTNTVLPYVDLANEVMESFVVHRDKYAAEASSPKRVTLAVHNVNGETSGELLAEPRHPNVTAYAVLKNAVYPLSMPYHQPIDAARAYLQHLGTSRHELLDTMRTAHDWDAAGDPRVHLDALHAEARERAVDAEALGMVHEEYILLTREAFWSKAYVEAVTGAPKADDAYRADIGVRPVPSYFGYEGPTAQADMLSLDETKKLGLTFVMAQFLPRTGVAYGDLVDALRTRFVNPLTVRSQALSRMTEIRASYRFLQQLVDETSMDAEARFARLVNHLVELQEALAAEDASDPCGRTRHTLLSPAELREWVHCDFEPLGKLIVLESGEPPTLARSGRITLRGGQPFGTLESTGEILGLDGASLGRVLPDASVSWTLGEGPKLLLYVRDEDDNLVGRLQNGRYVEITAGAWGPARWLPSVERCDLEKVRLRHLDGTELKPLEYGRILRFLRLWRRLGFTVAETDQLVYGLSRAAEATPESPPGATETNMYGAVCPVPPQAPKMEITPALLHEIVAMKEVLGRTALALPRLLTFWDTIGTYGDGALYEKVFLTHDLLGIDPIFAPDARGAYLEQGAKTSDHLFALATALRVDEAGVEAVRALRGLGDELTLATVSSYFRHAVLAKVLRVTLADLGHVFALFGDPFASPGAARALFRAWDEMERAGLGFTKLAFVVLGVDDPRRPSAPREAAVLKLAKTLSDGLLTIDREHADLGPLEEEKATVELVRAKAGLVFEPLVVERIVGLVEGTAVYSTNAPAGLSVTIPDTLEKRVKHAPGKAAVGAPAAAGQAQMVGVLSAADALAAKGLSPEPGWSAAIDRLQKQPRRLFDDALFGLFPAGDAKADAARAVLLAEDVLTGDTATPPNKRRALLSRLLPFLRERLARSLVVATLSGAVGLGVETTEALLADILVTPAGEPLLTPLLALREAAAGAALAWRGYLVPSGRDPVSFVAIADTAPSPVVVDGVAYPFLHQQEDPSNVFWTDPVTLDPSRLATLETSGLDPETLEWKSVVAPRAPLPASALLPELATTTLAAGLTGLAKAAILVQALALSPTEVRHFQAHGAQLSGFDWNAPTFAAWERLAAYHGLREGLPAGAVSLVDLFTWARDPAAAAIDVVAKIAATTGDDPKALAALVGARGFDVESPTLFGDERTLVTLRRAMDLVRRVGVAPEQLFAWGSPHSTFTTCQSIAEAMRFTVRSRYERTEWEEVAKPIFDGLRESQRRALVDFLLVQEPLRAWGVHDADGLFEFFLIDVQMDPCLETSRIKQAISTVQLFVQRCFLGQEERSGNGVPRDLLDRKRWEWMQRYRVWEANRKVFLYPENWIEPELRDDKSPIYKELESELLQKDVTRDTVETALKSYLFKLDEIANLKVVGVYYDKETRPGEAIVHVFARTRATPYGYFYRTFNETTRTWTPWSKVQVDIPSYEYSPLGKLIETGTYVVPSLWRGRPMIFFPIIVVRTVEPSGTLELPMQSQPLRYLEIRLGFSELRGGRWTPKQISTVSISTAPGFGTPDTSSLEFVPRAVDSAPHGPSLVIDVQQSAEIGVGSFAFNGANLSVAASLHGSPAKLVRTFHQVPMLATESRDVHSLQAFDRAAPSLEMSAPFFSDRVSSTTASVGGDAVLFTHRFAGDLVGRVAGRGIDAVYSYYEARYNAGAPDTADAYGLDGTSYHELRRPYALYNWEVGFHAPTLLADRLLKTQKFDEALAVLERVFDPKKAARSPADTKPYWTFPPFKEAKADRAMETFLRGLLPGKHDEIVSGWRDNPFSPHFVARARPSAYMKWTVMKYIEILLAYGDWYFRQNTLETIPYAIQLYVMAAHLFGPRGQRIPKRGEVARETYLSLLNKWDAFGNAMTELELMAPFSNQTSEATVPLAGEPAFANVFGFATTLHFCIPENPRLEEIRATIDDRLFKIRHCQDIDGIVRKLPLFEPPIDPALLVQATAQGLSLSSVLADLDGPMPNYRFPYLMQKALELCGELKALGAAFLATKEKRDAEGLARLRAKHERTMHMLTLEVRKLQVEEAERTIAALEQSRKGPASRMGYYLKLIGGDMGAVPKPDGDFRELPIAVDKPADAGGLRLTADEHEEMTKSDAAASFQEMVGALEALAGLLHAMPTFHTAAHPMGVGADVQWGFPNMANATSAQARVVRIDADRLAHESGRAGRKAGHKRQLWERTHQANQAGYELKNIDKQILTQKIRYSIASRELQNQERQLENALEVEDFLTNKYTNEELYSWMEGSLRGLYRQVYTLAFDVAKRAEKTFRFERGLAASKFLDVGYWNAARDGLLAGEQLYVGLKKLEAAYQEKRGHDFELTKAVSLRRLDPLAFLRLRETGACEFTLPEVLFDMDFPGHYARRIKSIGLSLPCVVGPYTSVNATLRLLEHEYRTSAIAKDKNDYPKREGEDDPRFATTNVPISAIAVSGAQNDSGVFELAFRDERYLPFEGAGAVSRWRLELPNKVRPFDYETLTDVVLHVRYTAIDGGDKLRATASAHVDAYVKTVEELAKNEGLFAAFDLASDFPDAWHRAKEPRVPAGERVLDLGSLYEWLPTFTKAWKPEKVLAADVILASSPAFSATLRAGSREVALSPGAALGSLATAVARGADVPLLDWKLTVTDPRASLGRGWLVVRYVLK